MQVNGCGGFPPRAFLIGAQKSATTAFAAALARHPSIGLSEPKEPHFFTTSWQRGLEWYRMRFPGAEKPVLLDASTSYTLCPFPGTERPDDPIIGTPERIASISPDARFLYLLRDPAARAYSAYWHAVRRGFERRPIARAVTPDSSYAAGSSYGFQLEQFRRVFPADRFLLIRLEAFVREPQRVLERCLAFLELDPAVLDYRPPETRNRSFRYNRFGERLVALAGGEATIKRMNLGTRSLVPERLRRLIARALTAEVPPLDPATRRMIEERLDPGRIDVAHFGDIAIIS